MWVMSWALSTSQIDDRWLRKMYGVVERPDYHRDDDYFVMHRWVEKNTPWGIFANSSLEAGVFKRNATDSENVYSLENCDSRVSFPPV